MSALRTLAQHDIFRPGDTVFVYTDGAVTVGREYGADEARRVFAVLRGQRPAAMDCPMLRARPPHLTLV